jgi:hypothetical protein
MTINLIPQRREKGLGTVIKNGDKLIIDGEEFDFTQLPNGGMLPFTAISGSIFANEVKRENGELIVNLILPHGANPVEEVKFPKPIVNPPDGEIKLPEFKSGYTESPTSLPNPLMNNINFNGIQAPETN